MKIKKNAFTLGLILAFVISCSNVEKKTDLNTPFNPISFKDLRKANELDIFLKNRPDKVMDYITADDFEVKGLDFMYKGEEILLDQDITKDVKLIRAVAKEPVLYLKKGDKDYDKYVVNNTDDVRSDTADIEKDSYKVEMDEYGNKAVYFLDQRAVYVTLYNTKDNTYREIMLNKPIKEKELPELGDNLRHKDLKEKSNNRLKYNVISRDQNDPIKDEVLGYYAEYNDEDDLFGKKKAAVETRVGNRFVKKEEKEIVFGEKIEDYKGRYEELLTDLDEKTLKFSHDRKTIEGGFKIRPLKFLQGNYKEENPGKELKFVTEIKGENKGVGNYKVVRKIIAGDKELFRKEETAHVSFPGFTVIVADSTFSDVTDNVENRIHRILPKSLDAKLEKNPIDVFGMNRSHGATVVGSAIDEVASGNSEFINLLFLTAPLKKIIYHHGYMKNYGKFDLYGQDLGLKDELTDHEKVYEAIYLFNQILKANLDKNGLSPIATRKYNEFDKILYSINQFKKYVKPKKEGEDKPTGNTTSRPTPTRVIGENPDEKLEIKYYKDKENTQEMTEDEKEAFLKEWYLKLYKALSDMTYITEEEKLAMTNINFKVLPIGDEKERLDTSNTAKYISRILDEDKNIKAINMSYGSSTRFEDYVAIKEMTKEQKEKAVKEYNENPEFRTAVHIWLDKIEEKDHYKNDAIGGSVGIPSVLDYFKSKDKITVDDYQKLLDLRLLELEARLSGAPELKLANYDVLFIASQGNTRGRGGQVNVDLTGFDKDGKKIIFEDGDKYYGSSFTGIHNYLNYKAKEKAKEKNKEFKPDYGYRKNMVSVVGLASKKSYPGFNATDNISDNYGLYTMSREYMTYSNGYNVFEHVANSLAYTNKLLAELEKIKKEPKKYSDEYKAEVEKQIETIKAWNNLKVDPNGRPLKMSFSRAGKEKLMTIAAEGQYYYVKNVDPELKEKYGSKPYFDHKKNENGVEKTEKEFNFEYNEDKLVKENPGSSFAAPRVTAVVGMVGYHFPWMDAHHIKQTIFTTADDDYRPVMMKMKTPDGKEVATQVLVGQYGVDENIGWGILNKNVALQGPGRFVKALTREAGNENFIANIESGTSVFRNHIEGGFDLVHHMYSRGLGKINDLDMVLYNIATGFEEEEFKSKKFQKNPDNKELIKFLKDNNINHDEIYTKHLDRINKEKEKYYASLDYEEKELFQDAGLEKLGKGKLVLQGLNKYTGETLVKEGTLIILGSSKSPITISEGAKLKIDFQKVKGYHDLALHGDVTNAGKLYSYSEKDLIKSKYKQVDNGNLLVSVDGKLVIDELDLSKARFLNYDIFRPYGSNFSRSSKDIIVIEKIPREALSKIRLGDIPISNTYKFNITMAPLTNKGEKTKKSGDKYYKLSDFPSSFASNPKKGAVELKPEEMDKYVRVVIKLKKDSLAGSHAESGPTSFESARANLEKFFNDRYKNGNNQGGNRVSNTNSLGETTANSVLSSKETVTPDMALEAIANHLNNELRASNSGGSLVAVNSAETVLSDLEDLSWIKKEDAHTLNGDVLANSQVLAFEYVEMKNKVLDNKVVRSKENKFAINFEVLNNSNFIVNKEKGDKYITNNGLLLFANYTKKHLNFTLGLNYINSVLFDYSLPVKPLVSLLANSEEKVTSLQGKVHGHNIGAFTGVNFEYNKGFLNSTFNVDYITKKIDRKIGNYETKDLQLNDMLFNLDLKGGYNFKIKDKYEITPFIGTNLSMYIKGEFDEDTQFGYRSNTETSFKAYATLGLKSRIQISDKFNIGANLSYKKYLTSPILKSNVSLVNYEFKRNIKGISLDDNVVSYGLDIRYKPIENLTLSAQYFGQNIKKQSLNMGLRFEF